MSDAPAAPRDDWHWCLPLIVLAGFCAYANSLRAPFILDDSGWITEGSKGHDLGEPLEYMGNKLAITRPFLAITLIANFHFHDINVLGYHVVNLFVHLLAGLALFGVTRRTLLLPQWKDHYRDNAPWFALAITLLWMLHPMQTQSVTYVIQRGELMVGLFLFLTLYCSLRAWDSERRFAWHLAAVGACTLGMGSKEVMAGAPILVVLFDLVFLSQSWRDTLRRRWVLYLGLAATWGVLLAGRILTVRVAPESALGSQWITRKDYFLTQPGVLLYYIRQSLWPTELCFDLQNWPIAKTVQDWLRPGLAVGALGLLSLVGLVLRRWWGYVGAWFFIVLGPTSSFIPITDVAFEQRMYIPILSIVVAVVVLGDALLSLPGWAPGVSPRGVAGLKIAAVAIVSGLLLFLTFHRNEDYASRPRLYADTVRKNPQCERAAYNLAQELHGRNEVEKVREYAQIALAISPNDYLTLQLCGRIEFTLGNFTQAVEYLRQGMQDEESKRPFALSVLGTSFHLMGEWTKAIEAFTSAIEHYDDADYRLGLALALHDAGRKEDAAEEIRKALKLRSWCAERANTDARRLALVPDERGSARRALFEARTACLAEPDNPRFLDTLAIAHAANSQFVMALATARQARDKAKADDDLRLAAEIDRRLLLFQKRLPYRVDTVRELASNP